MKSLYLNSGDKLNISVKNNDGPRRSYISYIDTVTDEHTFLIYAPIFKGQMIRLDENDDYEFVLYTQTGMYRTQGRILGHLIENNVSMINIQIGDLESIQRRESYRVNASFPFSFTRIQHGADENGEIPDYEGTAQNISCGGLCFFSPVLLTQNEAVLCSLPLKNRQISVEAVVLNIQQPSEAESLFGLYEYRTQFVCSDKPIEDALIQFVFEKQREMLMKRKMQQEFLESEGKPRKTSSRQ